MSVGSSALNVERSASCDAVFLSYASQDSEAAKRICEALRQAGVEVWFDQSELVGGDQWDAKIRGQIGSCALFVPVVSATTQARLEGYFRIEWKLAAQRTHAMAEEMAFLLPVVIDDTKDAAARVPAEFKAVQWTRLTGGETPPAFVQRVKKLLAGDVGPSLADARSELPDGRRQATPLQKPGVNKWWWALPIFGVTMALMLLLKESRPGIPANPPAAQPVSSRPEVTQILERVRAATGKIDILRTELDTMEGLLDQAAKLDPANAAIWAQWAALDCLYLDKHYDYTPARRDAARRHVAQAAGLDPDVPAVRLAQAMVMRRLADDAATTAEATKILQRLLTEIPADGRVPLELGWLAFDLVRPEAALEWFGRAAQVPGYGGSGHFTRARMLVYSGRTDQAGAEFDRALESGHSAEVLLWKAYILTIWNGDLAAARRALEEVPPQYFVEDMPAATRYYVALLSRNYDQALAAVRAVPHDYLQSVAYSGPAGYFAGNALALAGKSTAAELEWRSALALVERRLAAEPNGRELMEFKALLQVALGDSDAGRKTWQAARELYGTADVTNYAPALHVQLLPAAEALAWLEQEVAAGSNAVTAAQLRLDPVYNPIRPDPRFAALLAKAEADPRLSPKAPAKPAATAAITDDKSVAVLAFANLSDDKANEYFSDGISEELLNVLAKVPGLKVTARTSSFHFKGKDTPIPEIAKELGVAYVIEGSVRKSGDKVRITAQLIKAADGFHVWSDTFTRDLKDIFAVQDEIAGLIAQNLEMKMGMVAAAQTVDPEGYRLYLEALPAITLRTHEGYDRAEQLLTRAVERDSSLVPAQAALAVVWSFRAQEKLEISSPDSLEAQRILAQAEMAVRLGPGWAEAQAACGLIYSLTLRFAESEQFLRRAVQINPSYAPAHLWLGRTLLSTGRMDEALVELKRATELDPLSHRALDNYAFGLLDAGQPSAALGFAERALQLQPDSVQALEVKAAALANTGRLAEALAIADPMRAKSVGDLEYTIEVYFLAGRRSDLEALLTGSLPVRPLDRFYTLVALGRNEEAFVALESTAVDWGFSDSLLFSPLLDPIRHDRRFLTKLQSSGFAEFHARAQAWRVAHPPEKLK